MEMRIDREIYTYQGDKMEQEKLIALLKEMSLEER